MLLHSCHRRNPNRIRMCSHHSLKHIVRLFRMDLVDKHSVRNYARSNRQDKCIWHVLVLSVCSCHHWDIQVLHKDRMFRKIRPSIQVNIRKLVHLLREGRYHATYSDYLNRVQTHSRSQSSLRRIDRSIPFHAGLCFHLCSEECRICQPDKNHQQFRVDIGNCN